ncbi:MAG: hypothetical protein KDJ52_32670 [Anaerolineae bacterium]|nr:hypothetical protein [Anaerolineae bacterium]
MLQRNKLNIDNRLIFWVSLLLVIGAAIIIRIDLIERFRVSYDEAIHLVWLRLLDAGYEPYREIYVTYPPLYLLSIEALWKLWPTEVAQRWFSVGFAIFGAIGTALLTRRIAGSLAGVLAAVFILFSPVLLKPSREVMGEFHAVAWAVWAIWFIVGYQAASRPLWQRTYLVLSGLCLAASLLTKLLLPFIIPLIGGVIISRHWSAISTAPRRWQPLLLDLTWWAMAMIGPAVILLFMIYDTQPLLNQVIGQRLQAREAYAAAAGDWWGLRFAFMLGFARQELFLVVAALLGGVITWLSYRRYFWLLGFWLLTAGAFLAIHTPLREKHLLILIPVLAAWAGIGLAWLFLSLQRRRFSTAAIAGLIVLFILGSRQIPAILAYHHNTTTDLPVPADDEQQMLAFIEAVTAPDDCIITDHTPLLYWSRRLTPPELAEMSGNRLSAGALTTEELVEISERYACPVVAPVANRIIDSTPDYLVWVDAHYLGRVYFQEIPVYFAKREAAPPPQQPLQAEFAGQVAFHGYKLPQQPVTAGQKLPLRLTWERLAPLNEDYKFFVQLRNSEGATVASADYQPYAGLLPIGTWPEKLPLETVTWLTLPDDLPAGDYPLYIGLYQPFGDFQRMPLTGDTSGENALVIGPLQVR